MSGSRVTALTLALRACLAEAPAEGWTAAELAQRLGAKRADVQRLLDLEMLTDRVDLVGFGRYLPTAHCSPFTAHGGSF